MEEISSSEYAIDHQLSRLRWMPHLADPTRLTRLVMAACFAYIWIIPLGVLCEHDGWGRMMHRSERCDLSLFQLGLRLLEYLLNEDRAIPVAFYVSIET